MRQHRGGMQCVGLLHSAGNAWPCICSTCVVVQYLLAVLLQPVLQQLPLLLVRQVGPQALRPAGLRRREGLRLQLRLEGCVLGTGGCRVGGRGQRTRKGSATGGPEGGAGGCGDGQRWEATGHAARLPKLPTRSGEAGVVPPLTRVCLPTPHPLHLAQAGLAGAVEVAGGAVLVCRGQGVVCAVAGVHARQCEVGGWWSARVVHTATAQSRS